METRTRIHDIVADVAATSGMPGLSVAVAGPDGVVSSAAAGYADLATRRPVTPDDQYLWFSMTKIATATAAMRLHAEGCLDLDAPIGEYLAGYEGHIRHGHPTTRHLLTHTAGLANPLPVRWVRPEAAQEDPVEHQRILSRHQTPVRPIGSRAAYSNISYLLAAEVISAVAGQRIEQYVESAVLRPLGMHATGFEYVGDAPRATGYVRLPRALVPGLRWLLPPGIVGERVGGHSALRPFLVNGAGFGGLVGPVTDAVRLASVHAGGAVPDELWLTPVMLAEMRTMVAEGRPFDHGIGWFRRPQDAARAPGFVEHYGTGGGFWNAMRVYPGHGLAMVAMANTTRRWDVDDLFTRIGRLSWT